MLETRNFESWMGKLRWLERTLTVIVQAPSNYIYVLRTHTQSSSRVSSRVVQELLVFHVRLGILSQLILAQNQKSTQSVKFVS